MQNSIGNKPNTLSSARKYLANRNETKNKRPTVSIVAFNELSEMGVRLPKAAKKYSNARLNTLRAISIMPEKTSLKSSNLVVFCLRVNSRLVGPTWLVSTGGIYVVHKSISELTPTATSG